MIHCRAATQASLADLSDRDRAVQKVHAKLSGGLFRNPATRRCGDQKEKRLKGCLDKVRVECLTCYTTWFMIDLLIARTPIILCFEKVGRHQSQRQVIHILWQPTLEAPEISKTIGLEFVTGAMSNRVMKPQPTLLI